MKIFVYGNEEQQKEIEDNFPSGDFLFNKVTNTKITMPF